MSKQNRHGGNRCIPCARMQKILGAASAGRKHAALPPSGNETPVDARQAMAVGMAAVASGNLDRKVAQSRVRDKRAADQ